VSPALDNVDGNGESEAMSSTSIITIPRPSIYYDTCIRSYMTYARWSFDPLKKGELSKDAGALCFLHCNVGKRDGFGFSFSRRVNTVVGYSSTTWGHTNEYRPAQRMTPVDANTYGVGFRGQN